MENRTYIAIDLKSYYASVECVARGMDPLTTNLVVADESRTEKTICLAVSPALKALGIPGRARLFEVNQRVKEINDERRRRAPGHILADPSCSSGVLSLNPNAQVDFVIAPPRMNLYMETSAKIFGIYMNYVSPEDIHVYSIDEVFIDVTMYLQVYKKTPRELAMTMIRDVLKQTGITATAGIGTNLYLSKVAMDIVAKHIPADKDGVRIAELDEMSYRTLLWDHRPLTDFWRVGRGISKKLEQHGMYTMGDIARCSLGKPEELLNEDLLYRLFGINAELLIDHAWGWEPVTIKDIKSYRPSTNSLSSGQVLHCPYTNEKGRLIVKEMTDLLVLDIVEKRLVTDQIVLSIAYDIENMKDPERMRQYKGDVVLDYYGRMAPKMAHGSKNLKRPTSSTKEIMDAVVELYDEITDPNLLVRRVNVVANHLVREESIPEKEGEQLNLFEDPEESERRKEQEEVARKRERRRQDALIAIRNRYGKNSILKGMNFEEGATTRDRNSQVGGHKA